MRPLIFCFAFLFSASAFAADDVCGTSAATQERIEALDRWTASRPQLRALNAAERVVRDGIIILRADELNSPFNHPFDLAGQSLRLTRKDANTFSVHKEALQFDGNTGSVRAAQSITLPFEFPFFGGRLKEIYLSPFHGIFGAAPDTPAFDQYGLLEVAAQPLPVIAPLLTTPSVAGQTGAVIRVRTAADRVIVTWSIHRGAIASDVQAILFANGDILFSYAAVAGVPSGAIIVSPGRTSLSANAVTIASVTDAANDAAPALDIQSVSIDEATAVGTIDVRITLAARPARPARFDVIFGAEAPIRVSYSLLGDGTEEFSTPLWGPTLANPAAHVEDRTIIFSLLQETIGFVPGQPLPVTVRTSADDAELTATFQAAERPLMTDFSASDTAVDVSTIAAEAFTLPAFNPPGTWREIKAAYGFSDADFDSVAFYQNYDTDIVYYAGAYSMSGNPGVDGIDHRSSSANPRLPSLLHMNRIGFAKNTDAKSAARVLMHEFGHLWLYAFDIRENGANSRVLSPAGAHPAQYVDTRAAFTVYDADDASTMGGGFFNDHGDGTFTSSKYSAYGYSWLDLYIMGLAAPSEVQPSFYIAGSSLGPAYFPPERGTFRGTRKNITVDRVVEAMGPRVPAYPATQRRFRVLFVAVEDAGRPLSENDFAQLQLYRAAFIEKFAAATGNRAFVAADWNAPPPGKRRSVRK